MIIRKSKIEMGIILILQKDGGPSVYDFRITILELKNLQKNS